MAGADTVVLICPAWTIEDGAIKINGSGQGEAERKMVVILF